MTKEFFPGAAKANLFHAEEQPKPGDVLTADDVLEMLRDERYKTAAAFMNVIQGFAVDEPNSTYSTVAESTEFDRDRTRFFPDGMVTDQFSTTNGVATAQIAYISGGMQAVVRYRRYKNEEEAQAERKPKK